MMKCDCKTPDIIFTTEHVVCRACGVIMERIYSSTENYAIGGKKQFMMPQVDNIKFSKTVKKHFFSGTKEPGVRRLIRTSHYNLIKSLQFYDSINDHRIWSGFSTDVIIGAIGLLQSELTYVQNYEYSLQELVVISRLYTKLGGTKPIFQFFAGEILSMLRSREISYQNRKSAHQLVRDYYFRYLAELVDEITPTMKNYIALTSRVVSVKLFWLFVRVFKSLFSIHRKTPCAIHQNTVKTSKYLIRAIISIVDFFKPSQFRNFFIRITLLINQKREQHESPNSTSFNVWDPHRSSGGRGSVYFQKIQSAWQNEGKICRNEGKKSRPKSRKNRETTDQENCPHRTKSGAQRKAEIQETKYSSKWFEVFTDKDRQCQSLKAERIFDVPQQPHKYAGDREFGSKGSAGRNSIYRIKNSQDNGIFGKTIQQFGKKISRHFEIFSRNSNSRSLMKSCP